MRRARYWTGRWAAGQVTRRVLAVTALLPVIGAAIPAAALAAAHPHDGELLAPHDLWRAWSFEPGVIVALALTAWGYARGLRVLWARGAGRGGIGPGRIGARKVLSSAIGLEEGPGRTPGHGSPA